MTPLRVAIFGCGAIAEIVSGRVYRSRPDLVQVVAAVDRSLERAQSLAEPHGAGTYTSLADAFASEAIEAVDIRLPHQAHLDGALEALQYDVPVLVEKPLALDLSQGRQIVEAAERRGTPLFVGENYGLLPPVRAARRLLGEGAIGRLLVARTTRVFELAGVWVKDWRLRPGSAAAGVVLDQCCHQTRMLCEVVGEVAEVHAYASARATEGAVEDSAVVNCLLADGGIAQQLYCWASPTPQPRPELTLVGTQGSLEVHVSYDGPGGGAAVYRAGAGAPEWHATGTGYYDSVDAVVEEFARACRTGRSEVIDAASGLRDLAVTDAVYASIRTRMPVSVDAALTTPGDQAASVAPPAAGRHLDAHQGDAT